MVAWIVTAGNFTLQSVHITTIALDSVINHTMGTLVAAFESPIADKSDPIGFGHVSLAEGGRIVEHRRSGNWMSTVVTTTTPTNMIPRPEANPTKLPPPRSGCGHAMGVLLHKGSPTNGITVYLHRVTPDKTPDLTAMYSHLDSPNTIHPSARSDKDGKWIVLDVPTGHYFCSIYLGINTGRFGVIYLQSSLREIREGEVVDFGQYDPHPKD